MSDRVLDADRVLPCGHTVGMLVSFVADRTPPELADHVESCPYCPAELADLEQAWGLVARSADIAVQPPDGLIDRALTTVRGLRGTRGGDARELDQDRGVLRITQQAVLTLTRRACSDILEAYPGVYLRGCSGTVNQIRIDLVIRYPLPAHQLSESVTAELARALHDVLAAAAPAVSARVVDIAPPADPAR